MNPRSKFTCGCCPTRPEGANSDEVIFQYFGKEFTEYEYIVENLAIRPAPKKLLDLVPVHSADIKLGANKSNSSSSSNDSMIPKQQLSGAEGDVRKNAPFKIHDSEEFISFKKPLEGCQRRFAPSPYPEHPLTQPLSKPIRNITELRQTIKNKDYRTKANKQILSDLCRASEASLNIKPKTIKEDCKPVPREIKETIENLRFKKPLPNFYTRNENNLFQTPEVYCFNVKRTKKSSDTDLNNILNLNERKQPSLDSLNYGIDSMAQTDISKASPCPKKDKKSLKWKIIINKHSKS